MPAPHHELWEDRRTGQVMRGPELRNGRFQGTGTVGPAGRKRPGQEAKAAGSLQRTQAQRSDSQARAGGASAENSHGQQESLRTDSLSRCHVAHPSTSVTTQEQAGQDSQRQATACPGARRKLPGRNGDFFLIIFFSFLSSFSGLSCSFSCPASVGSAGSGHSPETSGL